MALTKMQLDHARERVYATAKYKAERAAAKLGDKPPIPRLTFKEKYNLIAAGKARLNPFESIASYTNLQDAFTYPTNEKEVAKAEAAVKAWEAKVEELRAAENRKATDLIDNLVLGGDTEKALFAIKQYTGE